jgi:hypothetical protein
MEQEALEQESFAIISQLLEFWEQHWLISKEDLAQLCTQIESKAVDASNIKANDLKMAVKVEKEKSMSLLPERLGSDGEPNASVTTELVGHVSEEKNYENLAIVTNSDGEPPHLSFGTESLSISEKNSSRTELPQIVDMSLSIKNEQEISNMASEPRISTKTEPINRTIEMDQITSISKTESVTIINGQEISIGFNEIPNVIPKKTVPKLKFGSQLPADKKPNGSWCYYTNLRETNVEKKSVLYQTTFSTPTILNPVPQATASVWFLMTKRVLRINIDSMEFGVSI